LSSIPVSLGQRRTRGQWPAGELPDGSSIVLG